MVLLFIIAPTFSSAAEYNDDDTCGGAGEPPQGSFHRKDTVNSYDYLICDGTNWKLTQRIDFTLGNTISGADILNPTATGQNNVLMGTRTVDSGDTPTESVFIGYEAGRYNNSDDAVGTTSFGAQVNGSNYSVMFGYRAGAGGTNEGVNIGSESNSRGQSVAFGSSANRYAGGSGNIALGTTAGIGVSGTSTAQHSLFLGHDAGRAITTGNNNIFIGRDAGNLTTTGSDNIIIGPFFQSSAPGASNELVIGGALYGDLTNNYIGFGNATPTETVDVTGDIQFTGVMTDVSDVHLKKNIKIIPNALVNLQKLRAVSFIMKDDPDNEVELGLIAQDVQKSFPALVHQGSRGYLSLNYQGMMGPMVEMVKELKQNSEELEVRLKDIEKRVQVLDRRQPIFERNIIKYNE